MLSPVLVVIGSGPGIGLSTASIFASRKFTKIALISRDSSRISKDKAAVVEAAKAAGRVCEVSTFSQDVAETASFQKTLKKVEELGEISCVFFNAARVHPSDLMTYEEKEIIEDFMVRCFPPFDRLQLKIVPDHEYRPSDHSPLGHATPHQKHR